MTSQCSGGDGARGSERTLGDAWRRGFLQQGRGRTYDWLPSWPLAYPACPSHLARETRTKLRAHK